MLAVTLWILLFLMTVVVHEVCHGLAAYALGDPTAKNAGRLTLNPLKHLDPFWTVIFPVLLFISTQGRFIIGMAKPVPVNFRLLGNPKKDMIWVALAGPLANFVLAAVFSFLWDYRPHAFVLYAVYFNLGIAFFNLVPIPPLDGSRIIAGLLPIPWARRYLQIEPFGFFIVFILYLTGFLFYAIIPCIDFSCRLLTIPTLSEFLSAIVRYT